MTESDGGYRPDDKLNSLFREKSDELLSRDHCDRQTRRKWVTFFDR